jgi:hypothetical protein
LRSSKLAELTRTVTRDVMEHPRDLSRFYQERYVVSRVTATKYIQKLEAEGWIARSGPSTHPVFSPGYKREIVRSYPLRGLDEQTPWEEDFDPYFSLRSNVRGIAHHGFTEMVNNAIDHSEGTMVHCRMHQDAKMLKISVLDDGIGIFRKISDALSLPDQRLALLELSKGKFTTDASRHSGEGVFFTSRMFDDFFIEANGLQYSHHDGHSRDLLAEEPDTLDGTWVFMQIDLSSARTTKEVFDQFTSGPDDFTFDKTVVPLNLARFGTEQLVSRSQAKRLIARFDRFRTVVLDFKGVDEIGQAFADELFRVYANEHPDIELVPTNMTQQVERMYRRVQSHRAEQRS